MLLIFDWDGTLSDSREHIVDAMQATIKSLQLPPQTDKHCAQMIGLGLRETAMTLFPDIDECAIIKFSEQYSENFIQLKRRYGAVQLFPGVIGTLVQLRKRGHLLAVATGKSRRGLDRVLAAANLADLFVATRGADETASKPSPVMLEALLSETGIPTKEAVMIGDTTYDMDMAAKIDMRRIAVSYGVHEVSVLEQYSPSLVIDRIDQLLQWSALR